MTSKEDPTPTDEPFVFVVKEGDQKYNQAHYEALGEVYIFSTVAQNLYSLFV